MWGSFLKYCAIVFGVLTVVRLILRKRWGSVDKTNEINAKGKIVIITGASGGIGQYTALEFAYREANYVILACRDLEKARNTVSWIRTKTSKGQLICMQMDLASLQSVRKFCKEFKSKYDHLDILINNAGVYFPSNYKKRTSENFEINFGVNHLGHFLLTNLLLEPLKKAAPSRIVTLSSLGHIWGNIDFDDLMGEKKIIKPSFFATDLYVNSKLANALFSKELSRRLNGTGVRTYALCPGIVNTDLPRYLIGLKKYILGFFSYFVKSPKEGAATTMYCALSKNLINESGEMYQHCGLWDSKSRIHLDDEVAKKLWIESAKLVNL